MTNQTTPLPRAHAHPTADESGQSLCKNEFTIKTTTINVDARPRAAPAHRLSTFAPSDPRYVDRRSRSFPKTCSSATRFRSRGSPPRPPLPPTPPYGIPKPRPTAAGAAGPQPERLPHQVRVQGAFVRSARWEQLRAGHHRLRRRKVDGGAPRAPRERPNTTPLPVHPPAPPPSLPYKVDTSRPSLRTNWTRRPPLSPILSPCALLWPQPSPQPPSDAAGLVHDDDRGAVQAHGARPSRPPPAPPPHPPR